MELSKLKDAPVSLKLLGTSLLVMNGLSYLSLLVHIYIDTQMKPSKIAEVYGFMEYIGLTDTTHTYLPYYTMFLFLVPVGMLMFSSYSEKLKRFMAIWPFFLILADIGSMWLIPYATEAFAYVVFPAGSLLGLTFLVLFLLLMWEFWIKKREVTSELTT